MNYYHTVDQLISDRRSDHSLGEIITSFLNSPHLLSEVENPFDLIRDLHPRDYLDCSTTLWQNLSTEFQIKYAEYYQAWYAQHRLGTSPDSGISLGYGADTIALKLIPPMRYIMGSPYDEPNHYIDEEQKTILTKKPFWMSASQVTQRQWFNIMRLWPSGVRCYDCPVDSVSFNEAKRFCKMIGCRLPREEEWEMACRAGTTSMWSFGYSGGDAYMWHEGNSDNVPHPVFQKKPNAFGLYDMHGNVDEWCDALYETDSVHDVDAHVRRGGSFRSPATRCRSAERGWFLADSERGKFLSVGFRIVRNFKG